MYELNYFIANSNISKLKYLLLLLNNVHEIRIINTYANKPHKHIHVENI